MATWALSITLVFFILFAIAWMSDTDWLGFAMYGVFFVVIIHIIRKAQYGKYDK